MAETPAVTYIPWPIAHTPAPLENGEPVAGRHPAEYLGPGVLHYIGSEFHLMAELNPYPFDPENPHRFRGDLVHRYTYFSGNITFSFEADEDYLYFTAHVFLAWQEPSDRTYAPASAYRATFTPWPMTVQQGETIHNAQYPWQRLVSGEFLIESRQNTPFSRYLNACEPDWDSVKGDRQVYAELMPNVGGRRPWFGTDFTLCMRRWQNNLVFSAEHLTKWRATDWETCAIAILDAEGNLVWELRDEVAGRGSYIEALVGHIVDSLGTEPPVLAPGEGKVLYDGYGQLSSVHVNTGEAMLRALITRIWYGVNPATGERAPYLYEARVKDQFDEDSSGGFSTIAWSSPEKFYYWSWDRLPGFVPAVTDPEILRRDEVDLLIPHLPVAPGVPSQENEDDAAAPWFYGASTATKE